VQAIAKPLHTQDTDFGELREYVHLSMWHVLECLQLVHLFSNSSFITVIYASDKVS
jgi:hypothetical protein